MLSDDQPYIPPMRPYELSELARDLVLLARYMLRPRGRLVFFLPTVTEDYQEVDVQAMLCDGMELVANSLQDFGSWGRRVSTLDCAGLHAKLSDGYAADHDPENDYGEVSAAHIRSRTCGHREPGIARPSTQGLPRKVLSEVQEERSRRYDERAIAGTTKVARVEVTIIHVRRWRRGGHRTRWARITEQYNTISRAGRNRRGTT